MSRILFFTLAILLACPAVGQDGGKRWATAVSSNPTNDRKVIYRFVQEFQPTFDRMRYATRFTLSWRYLSDSGLPSPADREAMDAFEDLLERDLDPTLLASLALVRTGNNLRQWNYYARSTAEFRAVLDRALRAANAPVDVAVTSDPEWSAYEQFVRGRTPVTPTPNPFIEATANSRPRYGSCAFLPPRGLLSAAPHVER